MTGVVLRAVAAASLACLASCATGAQLRRQTETMRAQLRTAFAAGAYTCAPVPLAMAETQLDFVEIELEQGNVVRAEEHKVRAMEALAGVLDGVSRCGRDAAPPPTRPAASADRDGDGIPDSTDECPDAKGPSSTRGCPDRDADGIVDSADRCPEVPEDLDGVADEDGCPEEEDRDGDGVLDTNDRCPDVAEDRDGFEDQDGCPDPDNDADGIPDSSDKCPLDSETANGFEDDDGCPDKKLDLVEVKRDIGKIEIKERVYFETGKATIRPVSYAVLGQVAEALKMAPTMKVLVEGHTDSVGDGRANLRLSQRRAESVREYLVEQGVAADRLTAIGFGEDRAIDTNRTSKGRERNRRVEFTITSE